MSIIDLPSDITNNIIKYLDNTSSTYLINTCKDTYTHGKNNGFVTYIKADLELNMMEFIKRFCQHSRIVTTVEIVGVPNAHLWIPEYVENLIFTRCHIPTYINPTKKVYVTKKIVLSDYNRNVHKNTVKINWEQFPNLETLELYVYKVDLTGIEKLNIKRLILNVCNLDAQNMTSIENITSINHETLMTSIEIGF